MSADVAPEAPATATLADAGPRARWRAAGERLAPYARPLARFVPPASVVAVLAVGAFFRFHELARVGVNSDEAVYAGTAASIAGDESLRGIFPVFRAHPVLFQMLVSLVYQGGVNDWSARAVSAAIGVLTVFVVYALGRKLYGHRAGLI